MNRTNDDSYLPGAHIPDFNPLTQALSSLFCLDLFLLACFLLSLPMCLVNFFRHTGLLTDWDFFFFLFYDLEITLLISVFLVVDVKFLQIIKFFYQCLDLVSVASSSRRKNLRKLTAAVVQTFSSRLWWIFLYYTSVCIQINYKFY